MELEDLNKIFPDNISEDYLINTMRNLLLEMDDWFVSYTNPPSGSWKEILLKKGEYIYRQVGAKRGVGNYKRPDVAAQHWHNDDKLTLFLIEAKLKRGDWSHDLPEMLQRYYEGFDEGFNSYGVKSNPFRFRRPIDERSWEKIQSEDERKWFKEIIVDYIFGFVYNIGVITEDLNLQNHKNWMIEQSRNIRRPVCFIGICWTKTREPKFLFHFSEQFPDEMKEEFRDKYPTIDTTSLDDFF